MEIMEIVAVVLLVLVLYFMRGKSKYKSRYNESIQNCARAINEKDEEEGPWNLLFIEFTNGTSSRKKRNKIFFFKNQKENFIFVKEPNFQPSGNKEAIPVDAMKIGDWYNIRQEIDAREDCTYFFFKQLLLNNTKRESKEILTVVNSNGK